MVDCTFAEDGRMRKRYVIQYLHIFHSGPQPPPCPGPALLHFKLRAIHFTHISQMSGNDIKVTEGKHWFKDSVDADAVEILWRCMVYTTQAVYFYVTERRQFAQMLQSQSYACLNTSKVDITCLNAPRWKYYQTLGYVAPNFAVRS